MHMKDDLQNRTAVPAPFRSRRKFILAAAATGGAGILSAVPVPISAHASSSEATQFVLPNGNK